MGIGADRPQARRRSLLAHAGHAHHLGRADPPGHRDHRPGGRQRRDREGHGETSSRASRRVSRSPAPLEKVPVFPAMVTQMISVGEETGSLDAMLSKIADFYEDEVNASVKSLTSILEPILMLGVGAHRRHRRHLDVPADLQHDEHRQVVTRREAVDERAAPRALRGDALAGDARRGRAPQPEPAAPHPQAVRLRRRAVRGPDAGGQPRTDQGGAALRPVAVASASRTYATAIVDGELRHHLRDSLLMRQPRWVKKVYQQIQDKSNELMHKLGRLPRGRELPEALNINEDGILEVMNLYSRIELHSRNEPFSRDGARRARRPERVRLAAAGVVRAAHRGPHRARTTRSTSFGLPEAADLPALLQGPDAERGRGGTRPHPEEGVARVDQGALGRLNGVMGKKVF